MATIKLTETEIKFMDSELKCRFPESCITMADFYEGEDENGVAVYEQPWYCIVTDDYDAWDDGSYDYSDAAAKAREIAESNPEMKVQLCAIHESTGVCVAASDVDEWF